MIEQTNQHLKNENIDVEVVIYGEKDFSKRANVISFNFKYGDDFVHHSLASLIYSDIFGIQLRSGCFCAGPYGMSLLKVSEEDANRIKEEVSLGIKKNKPGYLRLDLTFYLEPY